MEHVVTLDTRLIRSQYSSEAQFTVSCSVCGLIHGEEDHTEALIQADCLRQEPCNGPK